MSQMNFPRGQNKPGTEEAGRELHFPATLFHAERPDNLPLTVEDFARKHGFAGALKADHQLKYSAGEIEFLSTIFTSDNTRVWNAQSPIVNGDFTLLAAAQHLASSDKKALVIVPTKVGVNDLVSAASRSLNLSSPDDSSGADRVTKVMGSIAPDARPGIYADPNNRLIVTTPEALLADIMHKRVGLGEFSLAIFTHFHEATGESAYAKSARAIYELPEIKIIGQSIAGGSSRLEKIVLPHSDGFAVTKDMTPPKFNEVSVRLPEDLRQSSERLTREAARIYRILTGVAKKDFKMPPLQKLKLLAAQSRRGRSSSYSAELLFLGTLHEQLTTGGKFNFLNSCANRINSGKKTWCNERLFAPESVTMNIRRSLRRNVQGYHDLVNRAEADHPKESEVFRLLAERKEQRTIIFTKSASHAQFLADRITARFHGSGLSATHFSSGSSSKKSKDNLKAYKSGDAQVLVMTAKGLYGAAIPPADSLIIYSPVAEAKHLVKLQSLLKPSDAGEVGALDILITEGTSDKDMAGAGYAELAKMARLKYY